MQSTPTTFEQLYKRCNHLAEEARCRRAAEVQAPGFGPSAYPDELNTWTCPACAQTVSRQPSGLFWPCKCQWDAGNAASDAYYSEQWAEVVEDEWERTGVLAGFKDATFGNFHRREGTEKALDLCLRYVDDWEPKSRLGLFLFGSFGGGKTHLAVATIRALLEQYEVCPVFYPVVRLLRDIRARIDRQTNEDPIARCIGAEVLVLDDIGQENTTPFAREQLYTVMDGRYEAGLPTIITSNQNDAHLRDSLGGAFVSRLLDVCDAAKIEASDYRTERYKLRQRQGMEG